MIIQSRPMDNTGNTLWAMASWHFRPPKRPSRELIPNHVVVHPALLGRISAARIQPHPRKHPAILLRLCCTTGVTIALGLG